MEAEKVTFVERAGGDARAELSHLGTRAAEGGASCELLVSDAQPDLYLLVCRGGNGLQASAEGARVWRFRTLERFG